MGRSADVTHVAGRDGEESIWQPEWSPAGDLVFASDRSGWWNLERVRDGERSVLHAAEAEFGYPAWVFGARSFDFLDDGRMFVTSERGGRTRFGLLDPATGRAGGSRSSLRRLWQHAVGRSGRLVRGLRRRLRHDSERGRSARRRDRLDGDRCARARRCRWTVRHFSVPRAIEFPTENDLTAHALYYPPVNPAHDAPEDDAASVARDEPRRPDEPTRLRSSISRFSSGRVGASPSSTSTTADRRVTAVHTASA